MTTGMPIMVPHNEAVLFNEAEEAITGIRHVNELFLNLVRANPSAMNSTLELVATREGAIALSAFGHNITAAPRIVFNDGSALMEYSFTTPDGEDEVEVARFYLSRNGIFFNTVARDEQFGDVQHSAVIGSIIGRVAKGLLLSSLFRPKSDLTL